MVQVIQLPTQPAPTWGDDLANVAINLGNQYARKRERDDTRSEHLSDMQAQRDFEASQADKRTAAEARRDADIAQRERDLETMREGAAQRRADAEKRAVIISGLEAHGYLQPHGTSDDGKDVPYTDAEVAAAWQRAQHDGLVDRYKDLISQGYAKLSDIADPTKMDAAAQKKADVDSKDIQDAKVLQKTNAARGVADATAIQQRLADSQRKLAVLDARLSVPAEERITEPSQDEIKRAALIIAQQTIPNPKPDDISNAMPQARQTLLDYRLQLARQQDNQDKMLAAALHNQVASDSSLIREYTQKNVFGEVPQNQDVAAPSAAPAGARPAPVNFNASDFLSRFGVQQATPAAVSSAQVDNPMADPMIADFNRQEASDTLTGAITRAQQDLDQTTRAIANTRYRVQAMNRPGFGSGLELPYSGSVSDEVQNLSTLLQKQSALQNRIRQLQATQTQPTATAVPPTAATISPLATPAVSDVNESFPAVSTNPSVSTPQDWWNSQ